MTKYKYKAQEEWQKRNGLIAKTFKIKKSVVEDFIAACTVNQESQSSAITNLMQEYIKRTSN